MSDIGGWFSSLWGDSEQEMDTYSYEPILPEIVSNKVELKSKNDRKMGVISYLYVGLDEGMPYINVVHDISVRGMITEEKFMITSSYAESGRGAWFVEYECKNGIVFHFIRMGRMIETTVKKNGWVLKYYTIDVKYNKEHPFTLFNEKDIKSDMIRGELSDLYKFGELFEHAY
jgi:hypothetical protein